MKWNRTVYAITGLMLVVISAAADFASAAEIKVWTARAIATVLADVGPQFERSTSHKVTVSAGLPDAFTRRANAGESFDVIITVPPALDAFIKDGRVMAETRTNIARSGLGVEVRTGAPKPDISSVDAFKRALLDAKSIGYLRVGSGIDVARTLERLGIAEAVKSKEIRPESDIVSEMVAKGEIELGLIVITQILTTPGVELVGPFPPEIQSYTSFVAGVSAKTNEPAAARDLLRLLTGPIAIPVIKAQGMEPGASYSK